MPVDIALSTNEFEYLLQRRAQILKNQANVDFGGKTTLVDLLAWKREMIYAMESYFEAKVAFIKADE
jgi:hypothetical protein